MPRFQRKIIQLKDKSRVLRLLTVLRVGLWLTSCLPFLKIMGRLPFTQIRLNANKRKPTHGLVKNGLVRFLTSFVRVPGIQTRRFKLLPGSLVLNGRRGQS